jgi:hypothetical protein
MSLELLLLPVLYLGLGVLWISLCLVTRGMTFHPDAEMSWWKLFVVAATCWPYLAWSLIVHPERHERKHPS